MTAALASASTAQKMQLGSLAWQSDVATALFAVPAADTSTGLFGAPATSTGPDSTFFASASMVSLFSTQNATGLAYLRQHATAATGTVVSASA
jgi:hypothetical protein